MADENGGRRSTSKTRLLPSFKSKLTEESNTYSPSFPRTPKNEKTSALTIEGVLERKKIGAFASMHWEKFYYSVSSCTLYEHKDKDSKATNALALPNCTLRVERKLDKKMDKKSENIFTFCVHEQGKSAIVLRASNQNEYVNWVSTLRKICKQDGALCDVLPSGLSLYVREPALVFSEQGIILEANEAAADLFQVQTTGELVSADLATFVAGEWAVNDTRRVINRNTLQDLTMAVTAVEEKKHFVANFFPVQEEDELDAVEPKKIAKGRSCETLPGMRKRENRVASAIKESLLQDKWTDFALIKALCTAAYADGKNYPDFCRHLFVFLHRNGLLDDCLMSVVRQVLVDTSGRETIFRCDCAMLRLLVNYVGQTASEYIRLLLAPIVEVICSDAADMRECAQLLQESFTTSMDKCPLSVRKVLAYVYERTCDAYDSHTANLGLFHLFFFRLVCGDLLNPRYYALNSAIKTENALAASKVMAESYCNKAYVELFLRFCTPPEDYFPPLEFCLQDASYRECSMHNYIARYLDALSAQDAMNEVLRNWTRIAIDECTLPY